MVTAPVETELKLEYQHADLAGLLAQLGRLAQAGACLSLETAYFDTPERDLARAGYCLRVRREGERVVQTIKPLATGSAGLFTRREWETELPGPRAKIDLRCGPLRDAIPDLTVERLRPLFKLQVKRHLFRFEEGETLIAVAVDEGRIRANRRSEALCELELEFERGSTQAMFDLARTLHAQTPLHLSVRSKAERGYALADGAMKAAAHAEPVVLDPAITAAAAFPIIASACLKQFRANESLLAGADSVEALHQARVGLRRLRTAITLFRSLFVGDPERAALSARLRRLAADLGEVRNIDVLMTQPELPQDQLASARAKAMAQVLAELGQSQTRLLMIDLARWLAIGAWTHSAATSPGVTPFATHVLKTCRKRLRKRGRRLGRLSHEERHDVRIAAKKLRYAIAFFSSLFAGAKAEKRLRRMEKALGKLQAALGDLNDLHVAQETLAELGIIIPDEPTADDRKHRLLAQAKESNRALRRAKPFW
ncbi:MAG: CHAD domain-containing protein [Sphingomonadales bacterium]|nr:CHAD domain-containing protein [Sphingomonadales bacterium]MDE2170928.1 CHAD domain-containing protein [Sphingomonadales bacterium]